MIVNEIKLIDDCITIINNNQSLYIPCRTIIEELDNYYDNYADIKQSLEDEFIRYVRNKINSDKESEDRYIEYGSDELENWFYDDDFKEKLNNNIRNLSNTEYYIYMTNKINKKKIKDLEAKINYIYFLFICLCLTNIFNHISIN